MSKEELDFEHFKQYQLVNVDFVTGRIDVKQRTKKENSYRHIENVGSLNQDGYVRLWCNGTLRMKHRLLYWLFHGQLPNEIDHIDGQRANNSIKNLRSVDRTTNTKAKVPRTFKWLTEQEVEQLCQLIAKGQHTITDLATQFGRSRAQIKAIMDKKYWSHISNDYF